MKRYSCLDNKEIGQVFGGLYYGGVSESPASLEKALSKDNRVTKIVDKFVSNVKT